MANMIRTTLLLAGLTGILLLIGGFLGGRSGMLIALIFSVLMNFGSYWYSDKLVLKMCQLPRPKVRDLRLRKKSCRDWPVDTRIANP